MSARREAGRTRQPRGPRRASDDGVTSVEFALVALPFILLLVATIQIGIFHMTQAALNSGVVNAAESLRSAFKTGATFTPPSAATMKANVGANAGGLVANDASLAVDVRQLTTLASGAVPVADGTADFGSTTSVLAVRAQAQVISFFPWGAGLLVARSTALVRRQGQ